MEIKEALVKKILLLGIVLTLIALCSAQEIAPSFEGTWADDARQDITNPQSFISFSKLNDGRFFIVDCSSTRDHKPTWEVSISTIKGGILYARFTDGEWRFKIGHDKQGVESVLMEHLPDLEVPLLLIRVSSEPIKKLEGTVRGETFTK
jgi:hypothetical protein